VFTDELWRVDRATCWLCDESTDESTVWQVDRVTTWSWDELTGSPSVLLRFCTWLGGRKGIRPVKWWDTCVVICVARGANHLHMVQLIPLPPQQLTWSSKKPLCPAFNQLYDYYWFRTTLENQSTHTLQCRTSSLKSSLQNTQNQHQNSTASIYCNCNEQMDYKFEGLRRYNKRYTLTMNPTTGYTLHIRKKKTP